jgi:hypothetical protein
LPEGDDVDKTIITVNRGPRKKDLYEGIEGHAESEREEEREGGPEAPMKDRTGPVVLSPATYLEEDKEFDEERRRPVEELKKKYPPDKVPKDEYAAFR